MTFQQWLRKAFGPLAQVSRASRRGQSRQPSRYRFVPRLELLEDRLAPATFIVNSTADSATSSVGTVTLREAITASENHTQVNGTGPTGTGNDTIQFSSSIDGQTISLGNSVNDLSNTSTMAGPSAFFISNDTLVIDGQTGLTQGVTIARNSSAANFRLFDISSTGNLTLQGLTLSGGAADGFAGGNSQDHSGPGGGSAGLGGAIFNQGSLTIQNSTLTGNTAHGGAGGTAQSGTGGNYGGGAGGAGLGSVGGSVSSGYPGSNGGGPNGGAGGSFAAYPKAGYPGGNGMFGGGGGGGFSGPGYTYAGGNGGFGGGGGGGGFGGGGGGGGGFGGGGGGCYHGGGGGGGYGGGNGGQRGGGGGAGMGGAVFNDAGTVVITNSTFYDNSAIGGAAGLSTAQSGKGLGGGLFNYQGTITVNDSTFSENTANQGGRQIFNLGASVNATAHINNTILGQSDTTVEDFTGNATAVSGLGAGISDATGLNNLIRTQSGFRVNALGSMSIVSTADPLLAPLGKYLGLTQTMPLLPGSPAIDAGDNSLVPAGFIKDQRGQPRIFNGTVDIGAFESQGFAISVSSGSGQSTAESTAFANPLVASITSLNAIDPVVGGVVTFTPPSGGASATLTGSPATISGTNPSSIVGTASVTAVANGTAGSYSVTATANGVIGNNASFSLTNTVPLTGSTTATATGGVEGVTAATLANATFTDPNTGVPASDFTVTAANWGDGNTSTAGLSVSGSGGNYTVNGSHTYTEEGPYNFSITVTYTDGSTATITGSATVGDANLTGSNTATATGGIEGVTAATLSNATFTDANTGAPSSDFTVTAANWGDGNTSTAGLTVSGSGGNYTVNGSHLYADEETYNFSFTVKDKGGNTATITGSTTVGDANLTGSSAATTTGGVEGVTAATLSNASFTDANTGAPSSDFTVTAANWGDGNTSTAGLTVSGSGGSYTVSGSHLYAEEGPYNFSFTVKDKGGNTATITGSTTVGDASLTGSSAATATGAVEGVTAATLSNATFSDANTGAPSSDFTVTAANWGDGNTSTAGLSVSGSGGNYTVNGSHLYADEGPYNFSFTVKDKGGNTAVITGSNTVGDASLTGSSAATATGGVEGVTAATLSNATFSDANTGASSSDFTITAVTWGDGSTDTTGLSVSGNNGSYTVSGSHLYAEEGPYNFSFTVTDTGGNTATITGSTTVADANLTGSSNATATGGVEGVTAATLTATFSDANTGAPSSDFTVTAVTWGDGSTDTTGLTVSGSNGSYSVNGSHLYTEEGPYNFSLTVKDKGGNTATVTGSTTVGDASLTGSSTATATGGVEGVTAATLSNATFGDANTGAPSSDFTVTAANWGDGNTSTAGLTVSGSGGSYTVNGSHLYAEEGPYNFSITVTDTGGNTAVITGSATVGDANLTGSSTATATGGVEGVTAATLSNATFTDANTGAPSSDFTVTAVNWGDGNTSTAGLTVSGSGGNYTVNGSHLYAEEGPYNFSFTVMDKGGNTATITGSTTVGDASLTGSNTATASGGVEGVTAATLANATFTDVNTGASSSDFTVTAVTWGDGSTDTTGLSVSGSGGNYAVNGSHLYAEEGPYNFSFTVKDRGGNTATITGSTTVGDASLTGSSAATAIGSSGGLTPVVLSNAAFTDANTGAPASDFTVTAVSWGDGSTDTTGLTVSGSNGNYTVNGFHLYAQEGTCNFSITVMDRGGNTATITGSTTAGVSISANSSGSTSPAPLTADVASNNLSNHINQSLSDAFGQPATAAQINRIDLALLALEFEIAATLSGQGVAPLEASLDAYVLGEMDFNVWLGLLDSRGLDLSTTVNDLADIFWLEAALLAANNNAS
jgi:hypothetical protein